MAYDPDRYEREERAADVRLMVILLVLSTIALFCLILPADGCAQDLAPVPDVVLPEVGETVALERGDRAPWAGMLVRDEDLFALQSSVMTLQLQLANLRRLYDEAIVGRRRLLEEAALASDERVDLHTRLWRDRVAELNRALVESRSREGAAWYEHPALWFAIGVIATGALVFGGFALASGG
jgi:hypothetical protein